MDLDLPIWVAPTLVICIVVFGLLSTMLARLAMYTWLDGDPDNGLAFFAGTLSGASLIIGWCANIFYVYGVDEPFWAMIFIGGYILLTLKILKDAISTWRNGALA